MVSLISVSPPSYTLVLGLLLARPFLSTTLLLLEPLASTFSSSGNVLRGIIVSLLELRASTFSSSGNVLRGVIVSLLLLLATLAPPGVVGALELISALMGLWLRRLLSRVLVGGGRLR